MLTITCLYYSMIVIYHKIDLLGKIYLEVNLKIILTYLYIILICKLSLQLHMYTYLSIKKEERNSI